MAIGINRASTEQQQPCSTKDVLADARSFGSARWEYEFLSQSHGAGRSARDALQKARDAEWELLTVAKAYARACRR